MVLNYPLFFVPELARCSSAMCLSFDLFLSFTQLPNRCTDYILMNYSPFKIIHLRFFFNMQTYNRLRVNGNILSPTLNIDILVRYRYNIDIHVLKCKWRHKTRSEGHTGTLYDWFAREEPTHVLYWSYHNTLSYHIDCRYLSVSLFTSSCSSSRQNKNFVLHRVHSKREELFYTKQTMNNE